MLKGKETIHFNADASNIHAVNQLSIFGAVQNRCAQVGLTGDENGRERTLENVESVNGGVLKGVNSQEVNLLVSSPRPASGNSLR